MSHGKFCWNELITKDVEAAKRFYGASLGWTFDGMPMPDGTYWIAMAGGEQVAGIMAASTPEFASVAERWFNYVEVDDVDRRTRMAASAGGQVMREPFDIPNVGRIAFVADSGGAAIGLMTPAPR